METPKHLEQTKHTPNGCSKHVLKNHLSQKRYIELPIDAYKEEILQKVTDHDELIISAETGAGKSTRVPQFLYEAGYNVIVTQPRRLAATSLAKHVAHEMGCQLGGEVGYHIGGSLEGNRKISRDTKIKYCTDGLQLVQQLMSSKQQHGNKTVLIIDEVHEWNQNIEILIAWIKKEKQQGKDIKVILMSATLDQEALTRFFTLSLPPASVAVPGRLYPVEQEVADSRSLIPKTTQLVASQRNILIFQPGKAEIDATIDTLEKTLGNSAYIFPLHGELSVEDQEKIFKHYDKPVVVVSTNVAQTSVTIPYIDAVIDSGKEKRIELHNGVETLVLGDISQADVKQRAGRAGRCKPGIYIYCGDTPQSQLHDFPIAEIGRTRLDLNYLRILVKTGYPMEELDFFHQPPKENILHAKKTLQILGAISGDSQVTELGRKLVQLPVDVHEGCMILKACKYGVLDDILKVAAIKEQDGIISRKNGSNIPNECIDPSSDLLTQLYLYAKARGIKSIKNDGKTVPKGEMLEQIGVNPKAYFRTVETYRNLRELFGRDISKHTSSTLNDQQKKEHILKCITAGMIDNVWIDSHYGYKQDPYSSSRALCKSSRIRDKKIVVAEPKNIQFLDRRGCSQQIDILTHASEVQADWLKEFAPHMISNKKYSDQWDPSDQQVVHQFDTLFNGLTVKEEQLHSELSAESIKVFCMALAKENVHFENPALKEIYAHNQFVLSQLEKLEKNTVGTIKAFYSYDLGEYFYEILHNKGIITTKDFIEYIQSDKANLIEALKLNPPELLVRDYHKLLAHYPEYVRHKDRSYSVQYRAGRGNKILISVPESDIESLSQDSFSQYFEGKPYGFLVQEQSSTRETSNLEQYKYEKKQRYLDARWQDFDIAFNGEIHHPKFSFDDRDGQWDILEKCFDEKTNSMTYLGLAKIYGESQYVTKRFRSKIDAEQATQIIQQAYSAHLQEKVRRDNYSEKHAKLLNLYLEKETTLANTTGWERAPASYDITYLMNRIKDCLDKHDEYCQSDLEQIENLFSSLDSCMEQVHDHQKQFTEVNQLIEKFSIPDNIASLFVPKNLIQFINNIRSLPVKQLDEHILECCGRDRVRNHLIDVSGDEYFFCGADPNDVKGYIHNVVFGKYPDLYYEDSLSSTSEGNEVQGEATDILTPEDIQKLKNKRGSK